MDTTNKSSSSSSSSSGKDYDQTPIRVELNVDISCNSCIESIKNVFKQLSNTSIIDKDFSLQRIIVKTTDLTLDILDCLKDAGRNPSISGVGSGDNDNSVSKTAAAVCAVGTIEGWEKGCGGAGGEGVHGVYGPIRILQTNQSNKTLFEGRITGLQQGKHSIVVHEFGDIEKGVNSVGNPYISFDNQSTPANKKILATSMVHQDGKAEFRVLSDKYDYWDLIGRSIVLHSHDDQDQLSKRLAVGIICRAAGVGQNLKKICPCDNQTDKRIDDPKL
ncbi:hypothetical protein CYY_005242 [Polysphondylium violaceum]|uniref:Superoxide dismutase copper/zinc binding domain-containing protein n=1 Tax=Polysphondylium violaceum TaxID=133409 RepID=A0A8J4V4E5_9MYCE|nr:hypothetical protein CYY_005242 [Polysphondylium violaceum]